MKFSLTTLFLFLCIQITMSQDGRTLSSGRVMHFDKAVADAHIYNLSTNQGTITNSNGFFEIALKESDTILISHLEYTTRKVKVTKAMEGNLSIIFYVEIMTNYLNTVEIRNHDLSGVLFSDTETVKNRDSLFKAQNYIQNLMEIGQKRSDNTQLFNRSAGYVNDVDPIVMNGVGSSVGIGFKDKENNLRRELRSSKNATENIISLYGKSYFINTLNIPEDKIYNFLSYCEYKGTLELYKQNKIIELLNILQLESKVYLELQGE